MKDPNSLLEASQTMTSFRDFSERQTQTNNDDYLNMFCKDLSQINNRDECGWTPLYRTVISGILPATETLLNNGADPNIQNSMGETALYQAVEMEKLQHVILLLQRGANANIAQIDGMTPLHLAVIKQNILIVKNLLKAKANPNFKSNLYEQTSVHFAIKNNVDPMILLVLVQYNGSLFIKDKFGKKPLDYVKSEEMKKVIEKLKLEKEDGTPIKKKKINGKNKVFRLCSSQKIFSKLNLNDFDNNNNNYKKFNINLNGEIILKEPGLYRFNSEIFKNKNMKNIRKRLFKKIYDEDNFDTINTISSIPKNDGNNNKKSIYITKKINENIEQNNNSLQKISANKFNIIPSVKSKKKIIIDSTLTNKKFKNKPILKISKIPFTTPKNDKNNSTNNTSKNFYSNKGTSSTNNSTFCNTYSNFHANDTKQFGEVKKFSLIPHDTKNKNINISNKLKSRQVHKCFTTKNEFNSSSINNSKAFDYFNNNTKSNTINNDFDDKKILKPYSKPLLSTNENNLHSLYKNNSNVTFNIINNNNITSKNIFNKSIKYNNNKDSLNRYNYLANSKKKEILPTMLKKVSSQKRILNMKNLNIPYNKSRITTTSNNNRNSYNTSNNNESFENSYSIGYLSKKDSYASSSYYDSIILDTDLYPIYEWLRDIDLCVYAGLFIKKNICDMKKIIFNIKSGEMKITPDDIKKIGIKIIGHVYRIFVKIEMDADLIDNNLYEILATTKNSKIQNEENNILKTSVYNFCGCCSLKERSKSLSRISFNGKYQIDTWLSNIGMAKYKKNFIDNGFDKFEYFFLQMFSSHPIDVHILDKYLNIDNEKDRDLIVLQLHKDTKYLSYKITKEKELNNPKIVNCSMKEEEIQNKRRLSQECFIF